VTAISPTNAWAVGAYDAVATPGRATPDETLIEHWNGKSWTVQKSPNPGGSGNNNDLYDVAAASPSDVWAVGFEGPGPPGPSRAGPSRAIVEHRG
jgi:hypothetical protein